MKKNAKALCFLIGVLLAIALVAVGCNNNGSHMHAYSDAWAFDAESHWHPATCGHDAKGNKAEHSFVETVVPPGETTAGYTLRVCACGYSRVDDGSGAVSEYRYDAEQHWKFDGEKQTAKQPHAFVREVVAPTCTSVGYTKEVCACGYWKADPTTVVPAIAHKTDPTVWAFDGDTHWQPCLTCGMPIGTSGHEFEEHVTKPTHEAEGYTEFSCKICGYSYRGAATPKGHTFADTFSSDEFEHWHGAICGHETERADVAEHVFGSDGRTCVVCGKTVAPRLAYALDADGASYTVTGIGSIADTAIVVPDTWRDLPVAKIGDRAFVGANIASVTLGANVVAIGAQAFEDCSSLSSIDLSKCETIGFAAFAGCEALAPASFAALTEADEYAFAGTATATATLPSTLTDVADRLFFGCKKLTAVSLSAGRIGASAFEGCATLGAVTLTGTETIGARAFADCAALGTLSLPETVVRVGAQAFEGTQLLEEEGGVVYAANIAVGLNGATEVSLKEGTVGIADEAFRGETGITSLTLGGVRFVGVGAFRECTGVTSVEFGATVKLIGANAFRGSGLVSVTIPATVDTVGDNAFYDCMSLTTVDVSAKTIGKFAFSYTGVGRTLNSPEKVRPEGASLANVTLGAGVTEIGSNAFQYCPIGSLTLPGTLTGIGMYAFAQTDLAAIEIPASVSKIGAYAFYKTKLATATFATQTGWTAGKNALTLGDAAANATSLVTTYVDYDWIRG